MITFKKDTELNIVESFDEANDVISEQCNETFKAGELVDGDIISRDGKYVDLEFGDGTVALGVLRSCFTIVTNAALASRYQCNRGLGS